MGLRLFVAVDPAPEVRGRLRDAVERARRIAPTAKWVDPDALHVTLAFLGDRDEELVPAIAAALDEAVRGHGPVDLRLAGAGAFGGRRPRTLWVGTAGPAEALAGVQRAVCASLAPFGLEPEARPWSAHLTLARAREPRGDPALERCVEALAGEDFGVTRVTEVVLYRSVLSRSGPSYTKLQGARLAGAGA